MMTHASAAAVVLLGTFWTGAAWACDGKPGQADGGCEPTARGDERQADPAQSARRPELMGRESCAWTTTMMAQRVLAEGQPYTYVGHLVPTERVLASKVAAPYTIGPDGTIFVVANEVLDRLVGHGGEGSRIQVTGRLLEVEDVTYFVASALTPVRS
jgi:hypothetical protein